MSYADAAKSGPQQTDEEVSKDESFNGAESYTHMY